MSTSKLTLGQKDITMKIGKHDLNSDGNTK